MNPIGQRRGKLTIKGRVPGSGLWAAKCDCGNVRVDKKWNLLNKYKSCGCKRLENARRNHRRAMNRIFSR